MLVEDAGFQIMPQIVESWFQSIKIKSAKENK
jgi:hypothetical protein